MPVERRQWNEASRWLPYAESDMRAAELLISSADPLIHEAAFHCQQAAEKMAKALLILHGGAVPKIHDLEELSLRLRELNPDAGKAVEGLARLTEWYIGTRYPDLELDFNPSADDVRLALSRLRRLRGHIDALAPRT